jgi:hypothetical protein
MPFTVSVFVTLPTSVPFTEMFEAEADPFCKLRLFRSQRKKNTVGVRSVFTIAICGVRPALWAL